MCACHCAQLSYTTKHEAILIIFPLNLQGGISELKFINISLITMIIKKIWSISP